MSFEEFPEPVFEGPVYEEPQVQKKEEESRGVPKPLLNNKIASKFGDTIENSIGYLERGSPKEIELPRTIRELEKEHIKAILKNPKRILEMTPLKIGENKGKLPIDYSDLTIEEAAAIVQDPNSVDVDLEQPELTDKDLERAKLRDAVILFERTIEQAPIIRGIKQSINPLNYSNLTPEEVEAIVQDPHSVTVDLEQPDLTAKDLEKAKFRDALLLFEKTIEQSENPFGENLGALVVTLFADLHFTPSDTEKAGATNAFDIYAQVPVQWAEALQDKKIAKRFFDFVNSVAEGELTESKLDLLFKRDMLQETARHEFTEWLFKMALATPRAAEGEKAAKQMFVDLGDAVHGGGLLEDKLDISMRLRELFIERLKERRPDLEPLLIEIFGNHEERSRDPNATEYLNKVYGHRTFTQIAGDNVMIACFDTSMMGEGWMNQFNLRATDEQKEILYQRKEIQKRAWERVKQHDGQVILIGHDPNQMLTEFGEELKETNVTKVIGGHVHSESHQELFARNKQDQRVELHIIDSVVHLKNGIPQSPKAYKLSITGTEVSVMTSMRQPQEQFEKVVEYRLTNDVKNLEAFKGVRPNTLTQEDAHTKVSPEVLNIVAEQVINRLSEDEQMADLMNFQIDWGRRKFNVELKKGTTFYKVVNGLVSDILKARNTS